MAFSKLAQQMTPWWRHELFWPIVLVVVGVYFLLSNLGLIRGDLFWPLVLIGVGVWLILRRVRT